MLTKIFVLRCPLLTGCVLAFGNTTWLVNSSALVPLERPRQFVYPESLSKHHLRTSRPREPVRFALPSKGGPDGQIVDIVDDSSRLIDRWV
ncbi:hypothetical protein BJ508DRAFT_417669 [Ascobolus immersus RN42]|uniref:Uncharacterized protein n=1 Tax=Ascobolus immersus RN42 TaxID=1160509 RepID=A0A3N4HQW3_ASCIM|nr:hypothetical protein BJ508DRAFT_417669 [Ascobolus immersus RN42]